MTALTYELGKRARVDADSVPYIKCLHCGMVSFNPHDIVARYCGNCDRWHEGSPARLAARAMNGEPMTEPSNVAWSGSAKEFWNAVMRHVHNEHVESDAAVLQEVLEHALMVRIIAAQAQAIRERHNALLDLVREYKREFYNDGSIVDVDIARNKLFAVLRG